MKRVGRVMCFSGSADRNIFRLQMTDEQYSMSVIRKVTVFSSCLFLPMRRN
jgi:hypothetical protein